MRLCHYNKMETGILLLFSLVLLEFVSGLPLDENKRINGYGNDESHQVNSVSLQNLNEKTNEIAISIDLSQEQKNEDSIPMETRIAYGNIPNISSEQPPYGGFGHSFIPQWNSNRMEDADELHNQNQNQNVNKEPKQEHALNKNRDRVERTHWTFEEDYFKDRVPDFQRSGDRHSYHTRSSENHHECHHHHPHHNHHSHHWHSIFRSEATTTKISRETSAVPTTLPPIDIRMNV